MTGNCWHERACSIERYVSHCIHSFRRIGARITQSRRSVVSCLASASEPLSPQEIFDRITAGGGVKVDKVTVYRVLEALLELQLVHRVPPMGKYIACMHFESDGVYHVLSRCTQCEKVTEQDVPKELVSSLFLHLKRKAHFEANTHLLTIEGICETCVSS